MKRLALHILLVSLFLSSSTHLFAQAGSLSGNVRDSRTGESMPGSRIELISKDVETRRLGAIAGPEGRYTVRNVQPGNYILNVSYIGYKTYTVDLTFAANEEKSLMIPMIQDVIGLDEIVVTGAATRTQKSRAEVAVGRIDAASLTEKVAYGDLTQLIAGKVPGVTITQASGQVGGGLRFNVRSGAGLIAGNPVIFIDGVRIASGNFTGFGTGGQQVSQLADLNMNDIADIQILKGPAAAALYGTSSQNGVVLITTKSGRGSAQIGDDFRLFADWTMGTNTNHQDFTEDMALSYKDANAIFRTGDVRQFNVGAQGTSGMFTYYLGFQDRTEEGFVIQNEMNRKSVRGNFEAITSRNVTIRGNANYIQSYITRPQNDNNIYGWTGNTLLYGPGYSPVYDSLGQVVGTEAFSQSYLFTDSASIAHHENTIESNRFIGSFEANWLAFKGFNLRAIVGVDNTDRRNISFQPANFTYSFVEDGARSIFESSQFRMNYDVFASYDFILMEKLNITAIAGMQTFDVKSWSSTVNAETFPTELIKTVQTGQADKQSVAEGFSHYREAGIIGRVESNWEETYFLSFGMRNDYASTLGANTPNIIYPQVSGSVRLDKLGFLPELMNFAKFRLAYGETGSLPGFTQSQAFLWTAGQSPSGAGAILNNAGNPDINPERIREFEVGFDLEFLNAYGIEFTYFIQNATDAILNVPRPPSTGLGSKPFNVGAIDGWGFETMLYATPLRTRDYQLDFNLVFNYADNKVKDIGANEFLQDGFTRNFLIVGERRSQFMGPVVSHAREWTEERLLPFYGVTRVEDLHPIQLEQYLRRLGTYDFQLGPAVELDEEGNPIRKSLGPSSPLYTGQFSINFRFLRDFTFYASAEWGLGGYIYNGTRGFNSNPGFANNLRYIELATALGIAGAGTTYSNTTNFPKSAEMLFPQIAVKPMEGVTVLTPGTDEYQKAAEEFARFDHRDANGALANYLEEADWLRIRDISLRWDAAPMIKKYLPNFAPRSLGLAFSARNVALFTTYSGPEVEMNANPTSSLSQGQDFLTLMQARSFNFTISIGL